MQQEAATINGATAVLLRITNSGRLKKKAKAQTGGIVSSGQPSIHPCPCRYAD